VQEQQDVCVVGGGPAGLTAALTLAEAGRRVLLFESGGRRVSAAAQRLNAGDCEGETYAGLVRTRHRRLGGTANVWDVRIDGRIGAKYVPLGRRDLAGWPIGLDELRPHYVEAQELCGLGPFEYGAEYWTTDGRAPFAVDGTGLASGVYQFGYAERLTRDLVGRVCASDAITVVSSTVVQLVVDRAAGRLDALRAVDGSGRTAEVKPGVVILAGGAVENARLLLLAGLEGAWLGRGFMEHARDFSLSLVPRSPELFGDAGFYDLHASRDGVLVGGHLALSDDARETLTLPNAALTLIPRARRSLLRQLAARSGSAADHRYGWSRDPRAFDRVDLVLNLEQRPRPENRIEPGSRTDRFGNPVARLHLRWSEEEQQDLERLRELLREWFRAAGLGDLLTAPGRRPDLSAHHHAGTTRMAADPHDGVVDPDGRVFGLENAYVAGASVFPTAGFANPTLTVVALARRLGRHLAAAR